MLSRHTIRKENFKSYRRSRQASRIRSAESFEIYICCCEYRLFRFNTFVRYSRIRFTSRNNKFLSTFAEYSNQLSRREVIRVVIRMLSKLCIDVIQTTTRKRKRNRQEESKRMTRNLDHCIFCEIFDFEFRFYFFCFVALLVAISLVSELLRVLLVLDSLVATQSESHLSKSRLQALRENLRFKE